MSSIRKRARNLSSSGSDTGGAAAVDNDSDLELGSPLGSPRLAPAAKYHRAPSPPREFLCTLPPSCSQPTTTMRFASQAELDAHQASFHRWVCRVPIRDKPGRVGEGADVPVIPDLNAMPEHFSGRHPGGRGKSTKWRECGKMFPDGRLLELHETETHDPLARERIERGERIFACFLPPDQCKRTFFTPKKRRWHLINDHHYPKEYFFAVTNHGLNQLTRTDGLAASLIRPRRDFPVPMSVDAPDTASGSGAAPASLTKKPPLSPRAQTQAQLHPPHTAPPTARAVPSRPPPEVADVDVDMEALASQMAGLESSLSFIPRNVARKGRAKRGETRMAF